MKIRIKDNLSSRLKSIRAGNGFLRTAGFGGCEEENVFIHLPSTTIYNLYFEIMSRSRKRLVLMMSENVLNAGYPFHEALKELTKHEKICEDKVCQEHGWSKKKVIEVHEVAALKYYE